MINWLTAKGYMRSHDNDVFMGWVEKVSYNRKFLGFFLLLFKLQNLCFDPNTASQERSLTLSSVFLGKGHARALFPLIFAMCLQRLFLSVYQIYLPDYWPTEEQSVLRNSTSSRRSGSIRGSSDNVRQSSDAAVGSSVGRSESSSDEEKKKRKKSPTLSKK